MKKEERACQIWSVLALAARHRETLTYGELGRLVGAPSAALGEWLEPIQSYCKLKGLPPLTAVVVQKSTKRPGDGYTGSSSEEFLRDLTRVFDEPWLQRRNPGVEALGEAVRSLPSHGRRGSKT